MKKLLLTLPALLMPSFAFAQMFRPPVPAAQAQSYDTNATANFNNEVSAQGGAPQTPPPSDGNNGNMGGVTPSVSASFSQPSSADNLPPPQAPQEQAGSETPQEQATAQAVKGPQMQKQNNGPAQYQGSVRAQNLNPAANAGD